MKREFATIGPFGFTKWPLGQCWPWPSMGAALAIGALPGWSSLPWRARWQRYSATAPGIAYGAALP
jgi:hypothetical protein